MTTNEQTVEVLNDLIKINNDRIEGYQRAADEIKSTDADLKELFMKKADESYSYKQELEEKIAGLNGEVAKGTTVSGKIYRAWMDVKKKFAGSDRKAVLESCEYGEDAAQKAYSSALDSDNDIDIDTIKLITRQKSSLKNSHDEIKQYRDVQASVS